MKPLPTNISDAKLILIVDQWVSYLEAEDYQAAFDFTAQEPKRGWTPDLIRQVIKDYGAARPDQRVTLAGKPTDISQQKDVERWEENHAGIIGEIWYDLNIDGSVSDLTATFSLRLVPNGVVLELNDIHVM